MNFKSGCILKVLPNVVKNKLYVLSVIIRYYYLVSTVALLYSADTTRKQYVNLCGFSR